ncbi:hypothetical protein ENSA5_11920 [Enhygromyxa salina]|uniref:Uncharacterized protein n=1 Tax=Enhygromyxa salina TaxID=215803 RepID=A0A2S9YFY5_9BACT|nr:hypothetical protein [Enhygromyxa salina]PRQ04009.1 hypothetical protein ENSA5_11920 [Enhygromyxa salina]
MDLVNVAATAASLGGSVASNTLANRLERKAIERAERKAVRRKASQAEKALKGKGKGKAGKNNKPKAEKEGRGKGKKEKSGGGRWTCFARSFVLQIQKESPDHVCPLANKRIDGPSMSAGAQGAALIAAKTAFNTLMVRGCKPKHVKCHCTKR